MSVAGFPTLDADFLFPAETSLFGSPNAAIPEWNGQPLEGVPTWNTGVPFEDSLASELLEGAFEQCLAEAPEEAPDSQPQASEETVATEEPPMLQTLGLASLWMAIPESPPPPPEQTRVPGLPGEAVAPVQAPPPDASLLVPAVELADTASPFAGEPLPAALITSGETLSGDPEPIPQPQQDPEPEATAPRRDSQTVEMEQETSMPEVELKRSLESDAPLAHTPAVTTAPAAVPPSATDRAQVTAPQPGAAPALPKSAIDGKLVRSKGELAFELRLRPLVTTAHGEESSSETIAPEAQPTTPLSHNGTPPGDTGSQADGQASREPQTPAKTEPVAARPRPLTPPTLARDHDAPLHRDNGKHADEPLTVLDARAEPEISVRPATSRDTTAAPLTPQPAATHAPVDREPTRPAEEARAKAPVAEASPPDWTPTAKSASPMRDLHFQVDGPEGKPVNVRVHDRDGRVHVAVHAPNADHAQALRERVGELIGDIERHGFQADAPGLTASASDGAADRQDRGSQHSTDPVYEDPNQSNGSGQQRRQQQQRERQPELTPAPARETVTTWNAELETAVSGKE